MLRRALGMLAGARGRGPARTRPRTTTRPRTATRPVGTTRPAGSVARKAGSTVTRLLGRRGL